MLRWKNVSVPFVGGLREDVEPLLQSDGFSRLHWFAPDKDGSISLMDPVITGGYTIENRLPMINPTEGSATGDVKVIRRGNAYGYVRNGYLYAEAEGRLLRQGRVSPWVVEQSCITAATYNPFGVYGLIRHDSCISGPYMYTVFETAGLADLKVMVTEVATGNTVSTFVVAGGGDYVSSPRIVPASSASGSAALYYLRTSGSSTILMRSSVTTTAVATATSVTTDLSNANPKVYWKVVYDAFGDGSGGEFIAHNTLSTGNITWRRYSGGTQATSGSITKAKDAVVAIAVSSSSTSVRIPLAWAEADEGAPGTVAVYAAIRGSGTNIAATSVYSSFGDITDLDHAFPTYPFLVNRLGMCGAGTNVEFIAINHPNNGLHATGAFGGMTLGDAQPQVIGRFITTSGTIAGLTTTFGHRVQLVSRPWWDGTRACYMASYASGSSSEYGGSGLALTEDNRNRFFAVMASEPGPLFPNADFAFPLAHFGLDYAEPHHTVENPFEPRASIGHLILSSPCTEEDGTISLVGLERDQGQGLFRIMRYRLVKDDRVGQYAQLGGATYICGGVLTQWDGQVVREAGFLAEPCIQRVATPTGGTMTAGMYSLAVTFARTNAAGELLRSRPSEIKSFSVALNDQIVVSVSPPSPSILQSVVTATDNYPALPIRVEFWLTEPDSAGPFYLVATQDVAVSSASISQTIDEPASAIPLVTEITLPYSGNEEEELANDPPVSPVAIAEWRNRLWISDGYRVQYTKPYDRHRQAEFSSLQVLPKAAGPNIVAIVPLGQGLATICDETGGVAMLYGDGPDITGEGSTLQGPVVMQQSLGTVAPGAIGRIGSAAFVMTQSGLRLLTEGGAVERVGDQAEDSISDSPVRCVHVEGDESVTVLHGGSAERLTLPQKVWSTLSIDPSHWEGDRLGGRQGATLANLVDSGSIRTYPSNPQVTTPWYRPAGELGEFRIRRIWVQGKSGRTIVSGSTGLTIEIAYDGSSTWHSGATMTFSELALGNWEFRLTPARQRCRAFRLRFTFGLSAGTTTDPTLVALRFQIGRREPAGALLGGTKSKGMV